MPTEVILLIEAPGVRFSVNENPAGADRVVLTRENAMPFEGELPKFPADSRAGKFRDADPSSRGFSRPVVEGQRFETCVYVTERTDGSRRFGLIWLRLPVVTKPARKFERADYANFAWCVEADSVGEWKFPRMPDSTVTPVRSFVDRWLRRQLRYRVQVKLTD